MVTLRDNCKKTPLVVLHLHSVFPLCVPEQFAKVEQLYQLLHTCKKPFGAGRLRPTYFLAPAGYWAAFPTVV